MPKKRLVQTKLKFFKYTVHSKDDSKELEKQRQEEKEAHLKRIHRMLETKPKKEEQEEKIVEARPIDEPPWGDLPEMYPGQHQGKPFLPSKKIEDQEK